MKIAEAILVTSSLLSCLNYCPKFNSRKWARKWLSNTLPSKTL